ncbi:MAG: PQQ-dependent sugar dehydrogenase [Chloroflexi bacterium]|nr:PQQ-dependent sugar dehydrogenase [Chloroflexota bacterium]
MKAALLALLAVALALLLVACDDTGGGLEATPTATREPTQIPTLAPAATATPTPAIPDTPPSTTLDLPDGFAAYVIADGFIQPTSIALSPDYHIYVSERAGPVFRLEDADGDGVFEQKVLFAHHLSRVNGIAFSPQGQLFVSSQPIGAGGKVSIVLDTDGDTVGDETQDIITRLAAVFHQNNGLVFGPDGKLYITNGAECRDCILRNERSGTILQANPDGTELRIYARGVRNPYDLVFDAQGRLWATDNGEDPPCNTIDELNLIEEGGDYGWPYQPTCDALQSGIPPLVDLGLHTAATGIDYYGAEAFPSVYQGNLFITLWGSLIEPPRVGRTLVRVIIDEAAGELVGTLQEFATGFDNPIDVVTDRDGTLLVLDFGSGRLYRIVYTGV